MGVGKGVEHFGLIYRRRFAPTGQKRVRWGEKKERKKEKKSRIRKNDTGLERRWNGSAVEKVSK